MSNFDDNAKQVFHAYTRLCILDLDARIADMEARIAKLERRGVSKPRKGSKTAPTTPETTKSLRRPPRGPYGESEGEQ